MVPLTFVLRLHEPDDEHDEVLEVNDEVEQEEPEAGVALAQVEKTEDHHIAADDVEDPLETAALVECGLLHHEPARNYHPVEGQRHKDEMFECGAEHGDAQNPPSYLAGPPDEVEREADDGHFGFLLVGIPQGLVVGAQ